MSVMTDTCLSIDERLAFSEATRKVYMRSDDIRKEASLGHMRTTYGSNTEPIYIDDLPYAEYNGKLVRVLKKFNYVVDFANWINQLHKKDDFEEWLTIPRNLRCLYTPFAYMRQFDPDMKFKSLLVRNLAARTSGFQLREIFARYGYVRDVYIPVNHDTGRKCNYAFIEICMTTPYSQLLEDFSIFSILNGRELQVQEATSGRRSSQEMRGRFSHGSISHLP
jgi:hypothetical protein